ncbi:MAG: helix-turn-helix transcriptional regulator [Pyrinomonadaceae bacterium]
MGRNPRAKPKRLPEKLLHIREALGLSQSEMLLRLGLEEKLFRTAISGYELGTSEPSLLTILEYARVAGVCTDTLIDDELDLPARLPSKAKHSR